MTADALNQSPTGTPTGPVGRRPRIVVLGLGQMGLVCADLLARAEAAPGSGESPPPSVVAWGHDPDESATLSQTRRTARLPGFGLEPSVRVALDDSEVADADLVCCAVPVQFIRPVLERLHKPLRAEGRLPGFVSVSKGVEIESLLRPSEIIRRVLGPSEGAPPAVAALSGPTIAAELGRGLPATMVAASDDPALARKVQRQFSSSSLRVYTSDDLVGVEIAGALKNVIAIAAGTLDGLNAGFNAKSALLARGLAEITRLGLALGAKPETFAGLAGVGDLATTCFSPEGRNRGCGEALGKGSTLQEHLARTNSVVEGVDTTRAVVELAERLGVEMPIVDAVNGVLFDGLDPLAAISDLMSRPPKAERTR